MKYIFILKNNIYNKITQIMSVAVSVVLQQK